MQQRLGRGEPCKVALELAQTTLYFADAILSRAARAMTRVATCSICPGSRRGPARDFLRSSQHRSC